MVKVCTHFNPIINEKEFFEGLDCYFSESCSLLNYHQQEEQKLTKEDLWVCLDCYKTGCGRSRADQCMKNHSEKQNHHVSINSVKGLIWCYKCDDDLDTITEMARLTRSDENEITKEEKAEIKKKLKRMEEFTETVKQSTGEYLQRQNTEKQAEFFKPQFELKSMDIEEDAKSISLKRIKNSQSQNENEDKSYTNIQKG